jgi:acyl carrier protein
MDGFAYKQSMEQGKNWLSINWADWENNGGKPIDDRCANPVLGSTVVQLNITPEEGKETFKRVLSMASGGNRIPGIIVSSGNLHRRLQQWVSAEEAVASKRQGVHKRPQQLHSIYEAPQDEAEKIVAEIWQELLGIEMIGVHDNFFELGGHSLIATKLVSRLREIFRIDIPLPTLFERPTIRGVVENIAQNWGDPDTVAEIAAAYREVEMME